MSMTRWVVGNPESNDGTVLFLEETCAEAESNHLPKPLSRMREAFRSRRYSPRTEPTCRGRVRRIIVCHRLRHPDGGYETRTVRELPRHKDVPTTIYTHILNRGGRGDRSPVDKSVRKPSEGATCRGRLSRGRMAAWAALPLKSRSCRRRTVCS
jgi:hypothetical protein